MFPPRVTFPRHVAVLPLAVTATLLCTLLLSAQESGDKKAVPNNADRDKAEATLTKLYADKFQDAKSDKGAALRLATELLTQGKLTNDDDPMQFVALKLASELAAGAGDNATALEAVAALAKSFKVDVVDLKSDIYVQAEKHTTAKEDALVLTEAVLALVEEALDADNFAAAAKLMATADKAAVKGQTLNLASKVQKRTQEVEDAKKAFAFIKPFIDKADTDDKARLELGKYYVFAKGNFEKGLPLLAKSGDAALKELAERDLAKPKEARKQADLGDDWHGRGEVEKGLAQRQSLRRAYHWYQTALPNLEGLTKVRIGRQVEALAKLFPPSTGVPAPVVEITTELRAINNAHNGGIQCVALSDDGKLMLSGGNGDTLVRLWDATTGQKKLDLAGHNGSLLGVAISPDKKWGLSGGSDNTLRLWNLETGQEVRRFPGHNAGVRVVRFLPGGQQVISTCDDGAIRIFDANNGNLLRTLAGHAGHVMGLGVSKDGKRAVSGGYDQTVRLWDLEKGVEVLKFAPAGQVQHLALSQDGKHVVTTTLTNAVKVWEADTGKELHTLTNPGMIWQLAVSPDGRRIYAGGGGGLWNNGNNVPPNNMNSQIRVFDLATGKELRQLAGHSNYVMGLAFSADGQFLASCSHDGTVRLWGAK